MEHDGKRERPKVGLALGAGAARGLAHIGVLQVLEEENIPIDVIAGTSMGSVIGGLYAAGIPVTMLAKLAMHIKQKHWIDLVIPRMGFINGKKIEKMLQLLTQDKEFAQLNLPFAVVATDLRTGGEVIFTEGPVYQAIRASISMPGIFVPAQIGERLLVDGAVVNHTPADVARKLGADVVIGVDLSYHGAVNPKIDSVFAVIDRAITIMEQELAKARISSADVLIRPKVGEISISSFDKVEECLALGRSAAIEVIDKIKGLVKPYNK